MNPIYDIEPIFHNWNRRQALKSAHAWLSSHVGATTHKMLVYGNGTRHQGRAGADQAEEKHECITGAQVPGELRRQETSLGPF